MHMFKENLFTRRQVFVGGVATGAAALASCSIQPRKQSVPKLAIIHTNDSHGHDIETEDSLGMPAVAQLRSDYLKQGYDVLLFDAGDAVQGDNLVNRSKGDNAIAFMNSCAYDAMTLGNHEFDYGQDKIYDYVTAAEFPILSANVLVKATGEPMVDPYVILTTESGTKVGVFGLTTPETLTKANPILVGGLAFLEQDDLYACAQQQVDSLRSKGVDLVVCLAHLGEDDSSAPNRTQDVVARVRGVDLYIDGHDHKEECAWLEDASGNKTLVVETGCYTHAVGVVTWDGSSYETSLVRYGEYDGQDPTVAALVQEAADELSIELGELVATTPYLLNADNKPGVRVQETNMGDLVADAIFWEASLMADDAPDAAIINGGSIRRELQPGDITLGDVLNVQPYLNYIATTRVTGAQLLETIEASTAYTPDEMAGFPQVSNMSYEVRTTVAYEEGPAYPDSTYHSPANPGARVTITDVGGRGFAEDDTYVIATSDFLCVGGDTYYALAEGASTTMQSINYLTSDALRYYLEEALNGEVTPEYENPQGRIVVYS